MSEKDRTVKRRLKRRLEREANAAFLEEEITSLASRKVNESKLVEFEEDAEGQEVFQQDQRPEVTDSDPVPSFSGSSESVPGAGASDNIPYTDSLNFTNGDKNSKEPCLKGPLNNETTPTPICWDLNEYVEDKVSESSDEDMVKNDDTDVKAKNVGESLKNNLISWALKNNITLNATTDLLLILKSHGHDTLPKKATTLLKTPRNASASIETVKDGAQWYHGIFNCFKNNLDISMSNLVGDERVVLLDFFIDGISPYKAPRKRTSLWPIAGRIVCEEVKTKPFVIFLWCGSKKEPVDIDKFLAPFVEEYESLMKGFNLNGTNFKLKIHKGIADAPARELLKKVRNHNTKESCERCNVRSFRSNFRMIFDPESVGTLRTDENIKERTDAEHHTGTSLLGRIVGMVSQFPLDRMHLVDLGATRRIFKMLLDPKAKSPAKLRNEEVKLWNEYTELIRKFIPSDFSRPINLISDWAIYKASEFRRFLAPERSEGS